MVATGLSPARWRQGLLLLWLVALLLLLTGLNGPPLLDWDEGIVARVALELSQRPWAERLWPTYWGDPYLNKPPGLHLLVAATINSWRGLSPAPVAALPPPWLLRLAPAVISSLLAPLLALVQLQLRPGERLTALLTGTLALTLLPLLRHGHLLMLDGSQLVCMVLLWWALLAAGPANDGSRLQAAPAGHGLLAGLATSGLLLLKAPAALPLLLGTLLLRLLERTLSGRQWGLLALGLALGLVPGLAWHAGHLGVRGGDALQMWLGQGFARIGTALEGNSGGPQTPVLEVLEGGWPWLPLWPFGMALAWRQRRTRAGLWCLGLSVLTAGLVLPLRTQLPWYSLLLWPSFALVCAPALVWLLRRDRPGRPPGARVVAAIPWLWSLLGAVLLMAGSLAAMAAVWVRQGATALGGGGAGPSAGSATAISLQATLAGLPLHLLAPCALALGAGLLVGGLLLSSASLRRRQQGLGVLLLGDGLALLLLFASPLWLWELNETWPVADGLALLQEAGAGRDGAEVRLWRQGERPSLNWSMQKQIRPENHINLAPDGAIWLLGLESAEAPGLRCRTLGQRGRLRLERCQAVP